MLLLKCWCWYEPQHDKTNERICAPSKDSDQPGHPPILIRVFAVRMNKPWALSYPLSAQRKLWSDWAMTLFRLSRCPGWSVTHVILLTLSCCGSYLWRILQERLGPMRKTSHCLRYLNRLTEWGADKSFNNAHFLYKFCHILKWIMRDHFAS